MAKKVMRKGIPQEAEFAMIYDLMKYDKCQLRNTLSIVLFTENHTEKKCS